MTRKKDTIPKDRITIMIPREKLIALRQLQAKLIEFDKGTHSLSSVLSDCIKIPKGGKKK